MTDHPKTATLVKDMRANASGAHWKIYKLDPPLEYYAWDEDAPQTTEHVVISANVVPYSGAETYVFASDGEDVTHWSELDGSYRGGLDHEEALANIGYSVMSA